MKRIGIIFICTLLIGTGFLPMINSDDPTPIASNINGWWNTDWQYCKLLTIDNAINNYQMLINVSKNFGGDVDCNNHCKDDFGDIRFVDIDNTTCLSYWMETKVNSYYVRVWVKLPSDIENDGKILMYYGNPTAQTVSNGEQTFVFFDDFDDYNTDVWDEYDPNNKITVSVENGLLHIAYGTVSGGTTAGVYTDEKVAMYGRVVARLKAERGSNSWNMPLHLYLYSDSDNFMQNIYRHTGDDPTDSRYNIQYCTGGIYHESRYSSESYPSLEWRIFYHKRLQGFQASGAFTNYYNGDRIGNEATLDSSISGGPFNIRLWMRSFNSGLDGYYDWVFVADYSQSEPFVSSVGSEIVIPKPDTVYVDDDFDSSTSGWQYDCFDVIQDGIDAVEVGGTVYVYNGIYYENVVVDKSINLIGVDKNTTIIDAGGSGDVVHVSADGVKISEFKLQNSGNSGWPVRDAGIDLYSDYNTISNNIIMDNDFGIYTWNPNYNNVAGNIFKNNRWATHFYDYGNNNVISRNIFNLNLEGMIYLWRGTNNIISNNLVENNGGYGIVLLDSDYNTIFENIITNNGYGISLLESSNNNFVYHNNILTNIIQAKDTGENAWNDEYPSGGNYWDDYSGIDIFHGINQDIPGLDGIGDTIYSISGGSNKDNYPFMNPYGWEEPFTADVSIDIKPGDYPNTINPKSKGKIPVAILTTEDFNASWINTDSIDFLSASPYMVTMDDVDDDGDIDLLLHFKTEELDFNMLVDEGGEYPYAYLTGETSYGVLIEGKDTVRLVGQYTLLQQLLLQFSERFPVFEKILNQIII